MFNGIIETLVTDPIAFIWIGVGLGIVYFILLHFLEKRVCGKPVRFAAPTENLEMKDFVDYGGIS